ncbi:MAG: hypothetical protein HOL22_06800 [Euryarchaeota archaeon]|jgi:hypothetical protein|nr:hypothetical protein [Euryarchaeota archaeon]MBT6844155.1 hypothetical protein [Euryarchaeota archaeon]MBT7063826.1 hypothetical protein [Euryarchaeota archaeon]MBT7262539.1 hypothetical protein [Euryarchaeota archaeon]MBT7638719.1 hypothetical protein [Euryarchaeota archaeon]
MVELPQGDVTEVRRGGPESLQILSTDIARLGTTGYIRIERRPKEQMPRIGHIAFLEGKPMFALHEADAIAMSLEALLDIESDAALLDALLAIHELPIPDLNQLLSLHQEAHFQIDDQSEQNDNGHQWWSKSKLRTSSWRRQERLPELEVVVEAPEVIRQRSKALLQRFEGIEKMLRPGDAYFFDSNDPAPLFDLAGHLAVHGRPLFVLARHDIEALNVEHNIPIASSSWLSQNGDVRSTEPALENIRRKIDAFLWENLRAVVVLEGVEYLASLHGDDLVVNFLRDIVDGVRLEDHVFLATGDFNAFPLTTRQHLSRYMTDLESSVLEHWNLEPDLILDHPLCAPPSEEETKWIEQQLQLAISDSNPGDLSPQSTVFGTMEGGLETPDSEDILAATESLDNVIREWSQPAAIDPQEVIQSEQEISIAVSGPLEGEQTHQNEIPAPQQGADSIDEKEQDIIQTEAKQKAEPIEIPVVQIAKDVEKIIAPRTAQRIRRRRKTPTHRTKPRNQQGIQAAVVQAIEAKELKGIESEYSSRRSGFSKSLEAYANRQERAVENMRVRATAKSDSSLNDATRQHINRQELNLPETPLPNRSLESVKGRQPVNTQTILTPLMARPGASSSTPSKDVIRESASRQQSESTIESKLSIWEIEDRERLRKEAEGTKK